MIKTVGDLIGKLSEFPYDSPVAVHLGNVVDLDYGIRSVVSTNPPTATDFGSSNVTLTLADPV